jgi:hypothetical protein
MKDIILFATVFIISYLCFIGIIVGLFKLFFPFLTKEELEQHNNLLSVHK